MGVQLLASHMTLSRWLPGYGVCLQLKRDIKTLAPPHHLRPLTTTTDLNLKTLNLQSSTPFHLPTLNTNSPHTINQQRPQSCPTSHVSSSTSFSQQVLSSTAMAICQARTRFKSPSSGLSDNNNTTNMLPPSLGSFPLFESSAHKSLPSAMRAKGGYFFPMHRKWFLYCLQDFN